MMTVEIKQEPPAKENEAEVEIYDREGLSMLVDKLERLRAKGGHDHFMIPAWAGDELSEGRVGPGNILANHLRITACSALSDAP